MMDDMTYNEQFHNRLHELHGQMIVDKVQMGDKIKVLLQEFELKYGIAVNEVNLVKREYGNVIATEGVVIKLIIW